MASKVTTSEALKQLKMNTPNSFRKLVAAGAITPLEGGWNSDDVNRLAAQKLLVFEPYIGQGTVGFALPTTSPLLGASLYLSDHNNREKALEEVEKEIGEMPEGADVSGWWYCSMERRRMLLRDHGLLLGVVGGFVLQAARIIGPIISGSDETEKRCAFVVMPLEGEDFQRVAGFIPGMTQGGKYVHVPDLDGA